MVFKAAPLPGSFMITSIVGFLFSTMWVFPRSESYGVSFAIVFSLMFIASIISMTYADADEILLLDKRSHRR